MKRIYNISKVGFLASLLGLLMLTSCKEDFPGPLDTSSNQTFIKTIKITNSGENGNVVLEGTIDEDKKTISFPRLAPETDFSNLVFEAETSDGSKLDKESYQITFAVGKSLETMVIKVMNAPRYREYLVTLRLNVPVFGADFTKPTIYDYSSNVLGNPTYPSFSGGATRGTGFDGEHVLVIDRGAAGAHLLKVADLKNNVINRIPLNPAGMIGGTYVMNMGAQVHGHTYIASLSTSGTNPLKIYHWTDPSAAPTVVANLLTGTLLGAASNRYGDNISVNIDKQGNGNIFFIPVAGTQILRLSVANFTTVTDPTIMESPTAYGQFSSFYRVGNTADYLVTGYQKTISIANAAAGQSYTMKAASVPTDAVNARVIEFNGERYLMMITTARTGSQTATLFVYNITRGATLTEALTLFEQDGGARPFVYDYTLTSSTNTAPGSQTEFLVKKDQDGKDETLVIYTAHTDAGFAIIEFPKSTLADD